MDAKVGAKPRSVLIAGGAGFLGSRLCTVYVEKGYEVVCLDDLSTGRMKNVHALASNPNFRFISHDICDPLPDMGVFDLIYNMACPASPPKYQAQALKTLRSNLYGAFNLLELARRSGARILQSSTSEVYGDPSVSPQPESYWGNVNTVGPRSCYDEGKRTAETIFNEYRKAHNVDVRIARIFNVYGPGMDPSDGRVVSNFISQALGGHPITVYGNGEQTRSFCYRDDAVDGLINLMHSESADYRPMNIGSPVECTMRALAELVLSKTKSSSKITFLPMPEDDPQQRCPDISRARKVLGWEPRIKLADGLVETIAYFKEELEEQAMKEVTAG